MFWNCSVGLHKTMELDAMVERMTLSQFHTIDLTDNDLVKDHLRHLVLSLWISLFGGFRYLIWIGFSKLSHCFYSFGYMC